MRQRKPLWLGRDCWGYYLIPEFGFFDLIPEFEFLELIPEFEF